MPRESLIEAYLVRELKKVGVRADKYKTPGRRNAPDRICLKAWRQVFFVETKRPGEKPRPGQLREFCRLRDLGFLIYVIDCKEGVDDLVRVLNGGGL
jgi:hypothetical protein